MAPFGRKTSWRKKQLARCEAKAMKELEKEMKETVQREREVIGSRGGLEEGQKEHGGGAEEDLERGRGGLGEGQKEHGGGAEEDLERGRGGLGRDRRSMGEGQRRI